MDNDLISWGILGCGDVAEVKSGPAFNKVPNSKLVAVMRRDAAKAEDFAIRHQVPLWYDNAEEMLANDDINAVYIATPPSSHLDYALMALNAGKHVYLEKPMVMSSEEADVLVNAAKKSDRKLVVAHYRRELPLYKRVKALLEAQEIGDVRFIDIRFLKAHDHSSANNWRLDPEISGGGLFHDLAPHQLDLMYYFFGDFASAKGYAQSLNKETKVSDLVNGIINFNSGVQFRGIWDFNMPSGQEEDECTIYGNKGTIKFSFYGEELVLNRNGEIARSTYHNLENIQQPFIERTVKFFLGQEPNPCTAEEGKSIISLMDSFTKK